MEGIALGTEFIGSIFAYLGGVALLAFVVSGILFGYMSEEESKGNRLYWAEWPLPGSEETAPEVVKLRLVA
jgi:hypothetical protein